MKSAPLINAIFLLAVPLYSVYFLLWVYLNVVGYSENLANQFTSSYSLLLSLAIFPAYYVSHKWGLAKSLIGKAIFTTAVGMMFQILGQLSYAFYRFYLHQEAPYPSFGDTFFILGILLYISGQIYLYTAVSKVTIQKSKHFWTLIIVLALVFSSFYEIVYFKSVFDSLDTSLIQYILSNKLVFFVDQFYTLGAAVYLFFSLLTLAKSTRFYGAAMFNATALLCVSAIFYCLADALYSYLTIITDSWRPAGVDDLFYLISFAFQAAAMFAFYSTYFALRDLKAD